jgi:AcrR family transcriptional regulator
MPDRPTRDHILAIAHALVLSQGPSAVTFDAIARRLGRTKQAVIYWFPTRRDLLAALFLPALEAEAEAVITALEGAEGRAQAIDRALRALARFHLADLDRFRMMYLAPQTSRGRPGGAGLVDKVHPVTDRLYGVLARHLDPADPDGARAEALALHAALLGLMTMQGLASALKDPLKHDAETLTEALVAALTGRASAT